MLNEKRGLTGNFSDKACAMLTALGLALILVLLVASHAMAQSSVRPPDNAVNVDGRTVTTAGGSVRLPANAATNAPAAPGDSRPIDVVDEINPTKAETSLATQGPNSSATLWGLLRHGESGTVSIPDEKAAVLIQSEGASWLDWRAKNGPLQTYGVYAIGGMLALLALFFLLRGRIKIEGGRSGMLIERFAGIERFAHWIMAVSFILLALTGLNLLYGKDFILPLVGKEAFAQITVAGKWVHNNVAWPFMLGLIMVFVMWVWHNIPSVIDLKWMAKGGGLFSKGVHPPAKKFNAGQKLIFWSTILLGGSISLSGISLLFPYEAPMFAKTFQILNGIGVQHIIGYSLPETLTPMQEMQYAQIWHTLVSLVLIAIIIAHIYIGSLGMEGAFAAMGTGMVDRQWAKEHHGLWVEEEDAKVRSTSTPAATTPAE